MVEKDPNLSVVNISPVSYIKVSLSKTCKVEYLITIIITSLK